MRGIARAALAPIALVILAASCQVLRGVDEPRADPAPIDPCVHADPPVRTGLDDDPNTLHDYWFASERVILGSTPDGGAQRGFDLDHSCTCGHDLFDGGAACVTPPKGQTTCDFDGGVDDSLAVLSLGYRAIQQDFDLASPANTRINAGGTNVLLYVGRYNGLANDSDVDVALVPVTGLYSNLGCDGQVRSPGPENGSAPHPPVWDGCDRWSADKQHAYGTYPRRVPIKTDLGYVTNRTLVVNFPAQIGIEFFGEPVTMQGGVATAQLEPEGDSFRIEGTLAGRVPANELVNIVGRTAGGVENGKLLPLCKSQYWLLFREALCGSRDIMSDPNLDRHELPCDATSVTFGFIGRKAQVADHEVSADTTTDECDAGLVPKCP